MNVINSPKVSTGQLLHLGSLVVLFPLVWYGWKVLERPFPVVFWITIGIPIAHQVYVWLAWRLELRSGATGRVIGFKRYLILFFLLFAGRFILLITLAWLDRGSLGLSILYQTILTAILTLPGIYAMYSVVRYFGLKRAAGADHFDPQYREMPLVNNGIFRFTKNGMYVYAFLLHWAIAFAFDSSAALLATGFSHIYIWVHYYATEKPDMDFLYGSGKAENAQGGTY
ncbi:MAG TPA: methyltransferase [Gracilimonas sp.]|uniref:methyltransferase n=1 Tax=Gracilimonas sp. TaxID=1974203 RepID=UPI002D959B82|nr:methyltransferase [Gracilimonas sp.]